MLFLACANKLCFLKSKLGIKRKARGSLKRSRFLDIKQCARKIAFRIVGNRIRRYKSGLPQCCRFFSSLLARYSTEGCLYRRPEEVINRIYLKTRPPFFERWGTSLLGCWVLSIYSGDMRVLYIRMLCTCSTHAHALQYECPYLCSITWACSFTHLFGCALACRHACVHLRLLVPVLEE